MLTLAQPASAGKHYSLFAILDESGKLVDRIRLNHERTAIRAASTRSDHLIYFNRR